MVRSLFKTCFDVTLKKIYKSFACMMKTKCIITMTAIEQMLTIYYIICFYSLQQGVKTIFMQKKWFFLIIYTYPIS